MPTPVLTLPAIGMLVLSAAALAGAAVAALSGDRGRRKGGLLGAVLAVAGLLMLLGADMIALAWLATGSILAGFPAVVARPAVPSHPAGTARPAGALRSSVKARLAPGLPAILLGGLLVSVVRSIDWPDDPPPPVAGAAEIGGRLMTADLALLLGSGLLLVVVLASARWVYPPSRPSSGRTRSSDQREGA